MNLDTLHAEIMEYLQAKGLVVFHSDFRAIETHSAVYWNVENHPDYREFLQAAIAAGAKIVTFYSTRFSGSQVDDALEQLEEAGIERQDHRAIETRLRELRIYEGLVCQIELSFNHAQRDYIFDLRTEWYDDLNDLLDRIDSSFSQEEDDSPTDPGYYSKN